MVGDRMVGQLNELSSNQDIGWNSKTDSHHGLLIPLEQ
jgi:hypothetical protein